MKRLALAVAAALVLPVMALAALIGQQEYRLSRAVILNVALRGFDPRDLLRGHYFYGVLDWQWGSEPEASADNRPVDGGLCVITTEPGKPRVLFLAHWQSGDSGHEICRMVIGGRAWPRNGSVAPRFVPYDLDAGSGRMMLFVAEGRGAQLERVIAERPGSLTVDLAVKANGSAAIKALRLDGEVLGR